jgi:hypothetical protein
MDKADLEVGYLAILNGEAAKSLNAAKARYFVLKAEVDSLEIKIRGEQDPQKRGLATQSLEIAQAELGNLKGLVNRAVAEYTSAAESVKSWSVGMFSPEEVSGLAALPLAGVALALVAAGVAVAAVYALSDLVRAIRGQEIKTKGFIEQTADLLGQGKGVLVEMRQWIPILLGLAALGGGIYFLSKRRGRGSEAVSASSSVSLPALTGA